MDEVLNVSVSNGVIFEKVYRHKILEEWVAEFGGQLNKNGKYDWGNLVGKEVWEY